VSQTKTNNYSTKSANKQSYVKKDFHKADNFFAKDKDDIYTPRTYPKKKKKHTFFDDIVLPEYEMDRQKMRNKRAMDKKYKGNMKNYY
jgi:hypothetical protein